MRISTGVLGAGGWGPPALPRAWNAAELPGGDLRHTSLSQFILGAATERADQVIAEHQLTVVPSDFFDAFYEALAQPAAPDPALAALAATERPYQQR